ncbi:hypothetical protein DFR65_1134 [Oceanihabitans sediminis]|uniref:Uncharacterized protein n=1 Tax=Oceanihabitans sediminis TaxID=1812012 RepID=A0A368P3W3_9FLAO|nr:hypothetical protein DFR65_1134 [Oceanihabitans sediminis]RCU56970.1 hypothetical protein DU428_08450 [Oceanihabitans sediminis]
MFFLTSLTVFSQEKENSDRLLTYGLPMYTHQKAREFVGKRWGIEIYPVAACMVSQKLVDSANTVNSNLWKKMDSIHGIDSEKKFRKETIAEMKRIIEAQKIFDSDKHINKLKRKIERIKEQSSSNLESVSADGNIYYWTIYSFESENNPDFKWKPEFNVEVHLNEKKTEIIELE